jgi:ATP-binding protein involved in chromosome partitioning
VPGKVAIPGVAHVVAVASGKGGVGKSTLAVNLAVALAQDGARVGLIDADVYGPNVPAHAGRARAAVPEGRQDHPLTAHGLKVMSMGFLVDPETPGHLARADAARRHAELHARRRLGERSTTW